MHKKLRPFLLIIFVAFLFFSLFDFRNSLTATIYEPLCWWQTVTADNNTSRTITWITTEKGTAPFVEYQPPQTNAVIHTTTQEEKIQTDQGMVYRYTATLINLEPDTIYRYTIGDGHETSQTQSFRTGGNGSLKALIFGDSQSSDYTVWGTTFRNAYHQYNDADLFINMGNLVDNGADWKQWQQWFAQVKKGSRSIPTAPISGNHEDYTYDWHTTIPHLYTNIFQLPDNGPEGLQGRCYYYDYTNVRFIVLDTQWEELQKFQPDLLKKQVKWLQTILSANPQKWTVVLMHRPPFNTHGNEKLDQLGELFTPLFEQYGVDVVFTAHTHTYSRTGPLKKSLPADKGPLYISTGRSGDKTWQGARQKSTDLVFDLSLDQPNYIILEANATTLIIKNAKQDNKVTDSVVLIKQPPS